MCELEHLSVGLQRTQARRKDWRSRADLRPSVDTRPKYSIAVIAAIFLVVFLVPMGTSVNADEHVGGTGPWSTAVVIYEGEEGSIHSPVLVTDQAGGLHAFWWTEESLDEESAGLTLSIYYTRFDGDHWIDPVDIFEPSARNPVAAVTPSGIINLLWHGSLNRYQLARSTIAQEVSALEWTAATDLIEGNLHGFMAVDENGRLHALVPGREADGPIYQTSHDDGATWSAPEMISRTQRSDTSTDWVRAAFDGTGGIHVVWTEFQLPNGWPPTGVYYSKSTDDGATWSAPFEIAGEGYDQISIATVGSHEIHVVWNGMAGVHGRYHRWSPDGGVTWSEVNVISDQGATSGPPQMVFDTGGKLHLITSFAGCARYSYWLAEVESWSELSCASSLESMASGWIEEPSLALTEGNKLHLLYWDNRERLWYLSSKTPSPWVAPSSIDIADISGTERAQPRQTIPDVEVEQKVVSDADLSGLSLSSNGSSPSRVLIVSVIPAAIVTGAAMAIVLFRRQRGS